MTWRYFFLQNADLQSRVQYLEGCECVRQRCVWEGREVENGQRWQTDPNIVCTCTSGKVACQPNIKGNNDSGFDSYLFLPHSCPHLLSLFIFVTHLQQHTIKYLPMILVHVQQTLTHIELVLRK